MDQGGTRKRRGGGGGGGVRQGRTRIRHKQEYLGKGVAMRSIQLSERVDVVLLFF